MAGLRMRLPPRHDFRVTTRAHRKFLFGIIGLCVSGGERGIGSPPIQPILSVTESLFGRFPWDVSPIISIMARGFPALRQLRAGELIGEAPTMTGTGMGPQLHGP